MPYIELYAFVCGNFVSIKLYKHIRFDDAISCMNDRKSLSHHIPSRIIRFGGECVCVCVGRESCCILTKDVSIKEPTNSRGWEKLIFIYSRIYHLHTASSPHSANVYRYPFPLHSFTIHILTHAVVLSKFRFPSISQLPWCIRIYIYILRFTALDRTCKRHFIFGPRHK